MENIKDWYMTEFPEDELGQEIDETATFEGLFEVMDGYGDVYEYIFGNPMMGDSIVRERVFGRLAEIMEVPYEEVYDQWLMSARNNDMNDDMDDDVDAEGLLSDEDMLMPDEGEEWLVGNSYDHRDEMNIEIVENVMQKLYEVSALTLEGLDLSSFPEAYDFFYEKDPNVEAHIFSGEQMNEIFRLDGPFAYPRDLDIVSFFFTGDTIAQQVGGRWFDDIVDNNANSTGYHPFDATFEKDDIFESAEFNESTAFTEDVKNQKVRDAVSLIQALPAEQEKEALNLLKELDNTILDSTMLEPAFKIINSEESTEERNRIFQKHLSPNVRERLLHAAMLMMGREGFEDQTILGALQAIKQNQTVIDKIAEIAGEDFAEEVNLTFGESAGHLGSGMDQISLLMTIQDLMQDKGFPIVTEDHINRITNNVERRVRGHRDLGFEIMSIGAGDLGYARLSKEAKEKIMTIIDEEVERQLDFLRGKRKGTPVKFAKHRGGFPGTAKKTK